MSSTWLSASGVKTTPKNYHIPLEDRRRLIRSNASSACTALDGSSIYSPWPATTSSRSLGRDGITIPELAYATGVSQLAIRRLFGALHHLFGLILKKHLDGILAAVGAMPRGTPCLLAARRAAYLNATRGVHDRPTPLHFLLVEQRFSLRRTNGNRSTCSAT